MLINALKQIDRRVFCRIETQTNTATANIGIYGNVRTKLVEKGYTIHLITEQTGTVNER